MLVSEAISKDYKEQLLNEEKRPSTIRGYMCDLNFWVKYLEECSNCPALMEDLDSGSVTQFLLMLKEEGAIGQVAGRGLQCPSRCFYGLPIRLD